MQTCILCTFRKHPKRNTKIDSLKRVKYLKPYEYIYRSWIPSMRHKAHSKPRILQGFLILEKAFSTNKAIISFQFMNQIHFSIKPRGNKTHPFMPFKGWLNYPYTWTIQKLLKTPLFLWKPFSAYSSTKKSLKKIRDCFNSE